MYKFIFLFFSLFFSVSAFSDYFDQGNNSGTKYYEALLNQISAKLRLNCAIDVINSLENKKISKKIQMIKPLRKECSKFTLGERVAVQTFAPNFFTFYVLSENNIWIKMNSEKEMARYFYRIDYNYIATTSTEVCWGTSMESLEIDLVEFNRDRGFFAIIADKVGRGLKFISTSDFKFIDPRVEDELKICDKPITVNNGTLEPLFGK